MEVIRRAVAEGVTPSADLCVWLEGEELLGFRHGQAATHPRAQPLHPQATWDLASLTKPLVGTAVALAMIDAGELHFDSPVRGTTVADLLSHSAGYPAWLPLYEQTRDREQLLELAASTPRDAAPGTYSDLGFLTLCQHLEERGGERIDRLWERLVPHREGLSWGSSTATATEDCPVRGRVVQGEVHDLNCWAMGGHSSHAGLFGDARAVARAGWGFVQQARAGGALRRAWTTRGAGSHWLGWDGRSGGLSSSGRHFPDDAVGHLGFTGTSLWIAPTQGLVVALLTNRVHPSVCDTRIRALRPEVHDEVLRCLHQLDRWRVSFGSHG